VLKKHGLSATFFIATGYLDGGRMWNDTVTEAVRLARGSVLDLDGLGLGRYPISDMEQRCRVAEELLGRIKYLPLEERTRICDVLADQVGKALPDGLMMRREQVLAMRRAGMQIGAHTSTHPILAKLPAEEVRREILASKTYLEQLLNEPVTLFAYPNGKFGADYRLEDAKIVAACGFDAAFATNWGTAAPGCDPYQMPRFTPWDRSGLKFGLRLLRNLLARRGG
jgi:peptidoglycan/xylan/chitin deacetylase (PgdA/CDA1 family)